MSEIHASWTCHDAGMPAVTTLGGGDATQVQDIVEAHGNTIRVACQVVASNVLRKL
jgi:hypothetical protein